MNSKETDKRTTVIINKADYQELRIKLMRQGLTFTAWLREQMRKAVA